jgi:hypothetical protein
MPQGMRIFTGWNNPFGGSGDKETCKTLVSGALEEPLAGNSKSADLICT